MLRQAGAERAGAVLLLSADSTINFEAALQVRLLNPTAEIVVRSTSRLADLGTLLGSRSVRTTGEGSTDLLANLETAMALQQCWPEAGVAMLAHDFCAAEPLGELLGGWR